MARRIAFIHGDEADRATYRGGSWALPLTNLRDRDLKRVARSSTALSDDTMFEADLGRDRPIGGFALGPVNLSPGASYRVSLYAAADPNDPVYDSGLLQVPGSVVPSLDLAWEDPGFWYGIVEDESEELGFPRNLFDVFPTDINASLIRFEIFDESNGAGYIDLGRLLFGKVFRPRLNYTYGDNSFGIETLTDRQESLGGTEFFWRRAHRRVLRCVFDMMQEDQLFGDFFSMVSRLGVDRQLFVIPDPDDAATLQKRSFLATLSQVPALAQVFFQHGATGVDLKEVL